MLKLVINYYYYFNCSRLFILFSKDYLLKRLKKVEKEIEDNQEAVNKSTKVSLEEKNKINHLKFSPLVFQANRCEYCGNELDFPSVHCLCLHSFHQE